MNHEYSLHAIYEGRSFHGSAEDILRQNAVTAFSIFLEGKEVQAFFPAVQRAYLDGKLQAQVIPVDGQLIFRLASDTIDKHELFTVLSQFSVRLVNVFAYTQGSMDAVGRMFDLPGAVEKKAVAALVQLQANRNFRLRLFLNGHWQGELR